ncbi:uncharacterized protein LOC115704641 [Cannabis sativa]|uniref:uncharacterized protein LOC115704641 n=1 Tax=Cannabis sativa TaxID=3483 RepID=UPI0029CA878C|nr:uncharacterized protein LOC115704641 [Cannabis sativa]
MIKKKTLSENLIPSLFHSPDPPLSAFSLCGAGANGSNEPENPNLSPSSVCLSRSRSLSLYAFSLARWHCVFFLDLKEICSKDGDSSPSTKKDIHPNPNAQIAHQGSFSQGVDYGNSQRYTCSRDVVCLTMALRRKLKASVLTAFINFALTQGRRCTTRWNYDGHNIDLVCGSYSL